MRSSKASNIAPRQRPPIAQSPPLRPRLRGGGDGVIRVTQQTKPPRSPRPRRVQPAPRQQTPNGGDQPARIATAALAVKPANIALLGIYQHTQGARALLRIGGQVRVVRIGDWIGQRQIIRILSDRVIYTKGGQKFAWFVLGG